MWALIMTVHLGYNGAMGMTTLDNFQTEQACRYAGAQQEVALRNDLKLKTDGRYTFICVKKGEQMFGKLIGLATLPLDIAKDVITLGGTLNDEKSATMDKIEYLTGEKEFKREQERKDLEALAKALKNLR